MHGPQPLATGDEPRHAVGDIGNGQSPEGPDIVGADALHAALYSEPMGILSSVWSFRATPIQAVPAEVLYLVIFTHFRLETASSFSGNSLAGRLAQAEVPRCRQAEGIRRIAIEHTDDVMRGNLRHGLRRTCVTPPIWGVTSTRGEAHSGLSAAGGPLAKLSSAAPAIRLSASVPTRASMR